MLYPSVTLPELLTETATRVPQARALICDDRELNYATLAAETARAAAGFQRLGVNPGDRVALLMPNCVEFVVAFFGALQAGAIVTSTCPVYTAPEIVHQWREAGVKLAVVAGVLRPTVVAVRAEYSDLRDVVFCGSDQDCDLASEGWTTWTELLKGTDSPKAVEIGPEDLACLQFTGGTTGICKGAMLTHRNLVTNAYQFAGPVGVGRHGPEIFLGALPFFHIFGLTAIMVSAVATGSAIVVLSRFELDGVIDAVSRHRPTAFYGVPTMYVALLSRETLSPEDLGSVRICISGGGPMPADVQRRFQNRFPHIRIGEGYGLSETSPVTHVNPLYGEVRPGTIGPVVPDTEAKIVDVDTGSHELPDGEAGELIVRGPQVMRGYWNNPEDTARVLRAGWFHTGDIGVRDADGYFRIVDRKKDLVVAGGFNVYPREVEEALFHHPQIHEAMVIGVADQYRGETVKAFVVPRPGANLTTEDVVAHCRTRLAGYKVPRLVEFRDALPKSSVGKYLRRELRREAEGSIPPASRRFGDA